MASYCIVARPRATDPVWEISSEKVPHMTLLFLGEDLPEETVERIREFVQHVARLQRGQIYASFVRRGELGPNKADVLFLESEELKLIRNQLLSNDDITKAFLSVEQYPRWTPHVTLGYPESPPKKSVPYEEWVWFDSLEFWTTDYEGYSFPFGPPPEEQGGDYGMATESEVSALYTDLKSEILHYGIKGMKWGVRRKNPSKTTDDGEAKKPKISNSEDHDRSRELIKRKTQTLTNKELEEINRRLSLEKNYAELSSNRNISGASSKINAALKVYRTASEVYKVLDNPLTAGVVSAMRK